MPLFGGKDCPQNKAFAGPAKDGVRYDDDRVQWRPKGMLQSIRSEKNGEDRTWLETINESIALCIPGESVSTVKGSTRLPVAAMVSHPGGIDQCFHRDYGKQLIYECDF